MATRVEEHLQRLWGRLYGYALALLANPDLAQELMQNAALKALAAGNPPADERAIRAWLFAIVRNGAIDELRRNRRMTARVCGENVDAIPNGTPWTFDDRLIAEITVRQALQKIEPIYRDVIALVDVAGFGYADAAEIVGIPIGTVMSRISRGRAAMLEVIGGTNLRSLRVKRRSR